jgi:arabinogalactan endo-1,4-beta-galactosidase
VVIAETAYPFTLQWNDYTNNVVGTSDNLTDAYPPTPEGQKSYLLAIRAAIRSANGLGFCYWGGEWVAYKGANAKDGSSWENQALFDFQNRALPVLEAFKRE